MKAPLELQCRRKGCTRPACEASDGLCLVHFQVPVSTEPLIDIREQFGGPRYDPSRDATHADILRDAIFGVRSEPWRPRNA